MSQLSEYREARAAFEDAVKAPLIDQIAHLIEKLEDAQTEHNSLRESSASLIGQQQRQITQLQQRVRSLNDELDDLTYEPPVSDYDYWRYGY